MTNHEPKPRTRAAISISLDGFIAGPNGGTADNPLGDGGDRLHQWIYGLESWRRQHGLEGGESSTNDEVIAETTRGVGATILGRRMFDEGERYWGEEPPFHCPVFILTHERRDPEEKSGGTTYTFLDAGPQKALERAREAAGGGDVAIAGGAATIREFLAADLLDELQLHVVPLIMGEGNRLLDGPELDGIELRPLRAVEGEGVTHLKYEPLRSGSGG